jgi:hypothetical protein
VTDQNDDELDRWLNEDVELLTPAPGTFERVRHRARQRKARQALASAAALAVVIVGGVSAPAIISSLTSQASTARPGRRAWPGAAPTTATPSGALLPRPPRSRSPPRSPHPASVGQSVGDDRPVVAQPAPGRGHGGGGLPAHLDHVRQQYWRGIGQGQLLALRTGQPTCTSALAGTDDYGRTGSACPALTAGSPDGAASVSQLRFLNEPRASRSAPRCG